MLMAIDDWRDRAVRANSQAPAGNPVQIALVATFKGGLKTNMKKLMLLVLMIAVLTFAGAAVAQVMTDVLGAHNVDGHGCASCHQPHSGSCGNTTGQGLTGCDDTTGTIALWGRGWLAKTYTVNLPHGSNYQFATPGATSGFIGGDSDPLFSTATCLTCHDGSVTVAGMKGYTFETNDDGGTPPTWFGTESGVTPLTNMHPVHTTYSCGGYNWDCTVNTTTGAIYWGNSTQQQAFINNYGRTVSFKSAGVGGTTIVTNGNTGPSTVAGSYIECTTCHNQHVMGGGYTEYKYQPQTWVSTPANQNCVVGANANNPYCGSYGNNGNATYKPTWFFVAGWYDMKNPASNSATQFCRQCHGSESNEENNVLTTPTT